MKNTPFSTSPLTRIGLDTKNQQKFLEHLIHPSTLAVITNNQGQVGIQGGSENIRVALFPLRTIFPELEDKCSSVETYYLGFLGNSCVVVLNVSQLEKLDTTWEFKDVRSLLFSGVEETIGLAGQATALSNWHIRNKFCGKCGSPTLSCESGTRRMCSTSDCKSKLYPRIDPCVIVTVESINGDKCLLGRRKGFKFFSTLAGFIEPSETAEQACRREVKEEVGISLGTVKLAGSQPWPPGRAGNCELMIGCFGKALNEDLTLDNNEIVEAKWFSREEIQEALERSKTPQCREVMLGTASDEGKLWVPGPYAIAHLLMEEWCEQKKSFL